MKKYINVILQSLPLVAVVIILCILGTLFWYCNKKNDSRHQQPETIKFPTITEGMAISNFIKQKTKIIYNDLKEKYKQRKKVLNTFAPFKTTRDRILYPVYYINLDRDVKRKRKMEKQFAKYNIKTTRISAIDGKKLKSLNNGEVNGVKFINRFNLSPGELGCTLSHLFAILKGYEDGHEIIVVMEDDVGLDLIPYWSFDLPILLENNVSKEWNIVQLMSMNYSSFDNLNKVVPWKYNYYGTQAYVINRQGMKRILSRLYNNGTFILSLKQKPRLPPPYGVADRLLYESVDKTFTINAPLFFVLNMGTTIHIGLGSDIMGLNQAVNTLSQYIVRSLLYEKSLTY